MNDSVLVELSVMEKKGKLLLTLLSGKGHMPVKLDAELSGDREDIGDMGVEGIELSGDNVVVSDESSRSPSIVHLLSVVSERGILSPMLNRLRSEEGGVEISLLCVRGERRMLGGGGWSLTIMTGEEGTLFGGASLVEKLLTLLCPASLTPRGMVRRF